jgi:hypothetical protein
LQEQFEKLSRSTDDIAELRHVIANQFRVFDRDAWSPAPWPWVYGDAMSLPPPETPRQNGALTSTQLAMVQQWSAGDFDDDYEPVTLRRAALRTFRSLNNRICLIVPRSNSASLTHFIQVVR